METSEELIEKIYGKDWRKDKKLSTILKCIKCSKEFYSAFRWSEDCPVMGMANNHITILDCNCDKNGNDIMCPIHCYAK